LVKPAKAGCSVVPAEYLERRLISAPSAVPAPSSARNVRVDAGPPEPRDFPLFDFASHGGAVWFGIVDERSSWNVDPTCGDRGMTAFLFGRVVATAWEKSDLHGSASCGLRASPLDDLNRNQGQVLLIPRTAGCNAGLLGDWIRPLSRLFD